MDRPETPLKLEIEDNIQTYQYKLTEVKTLAKQRKQEIKLLAQDKIKIREELKLLKKE